jgi:hypothetical protein
MIILPWDVSVELHLLVTGVCMSDAFLSINKMTDLVHLEHRTPDLVINVYQIIYGYEEYNRRLDTFMSDANEIYSDTFMFVCAATLRPCCM